LITFNLLGTVCHGRIKKLVSGEVRVKLKLREEKTNMKLDLTVLIEQGEDGAYVASVPSLKSCYTQADTIPELLEKIREAALLCLEVEEDISYTNRFIGVQQMEILYEQA